MGKVGRNWTWKKIAEESLMSLTQIKKELREYSSKKQSKILQRFFKTGPGEYGEGDIFIGVKVPAIRELAKKHQNLPLKETLKLLKSPIHEERLLALLILVIRYPGANDSQKRAIYELYLKHTKYINNWDLVDLTASHIVGPYLVSKPKKILYELAKSKLLWDRRISIIATHYYIKNNQFKDTLKIAKILLTDKEDLMHKAVGWMLREVGKRDLKPLEAFLKAHYKDIPRTTLRYAIERFPEPKRQAYLKNQI